MGSDRSHLPDRALRQQAGGGSGHTFYGVAYLDHFNSVLRLAVVLRVNRLRVQPKHAAH